MIPKIRSYIHTLITDPFLVNNAVFFIGSLLVSFLNYLYHPILGRLLSVSNFGDLEAILVVYAQIGIILGVFGRIVVNEIAHADTSAEAHKQEVAEVRELYSLAMALVGTVAVLMAIFCVPLAQVFHATSPSSVLVLAALILLNIPYTFQSSILQGLQHFHTVAFLNATIAGGRLVIAIVLVLLGFGINGAIIALAIAQLFSLTYATYRTRGKFSLKLTHLPRMPFLRRTVPYALLILISTAVGTILFSADLVVVKYFFNAESAGLYSGISIIDNVIFFITGSIVAVLLPSIKRSNTFQINHRTLVKALLLTCAIGGGALLIFVLFPAKVVTLMIGEKYLSYSAYLPRLSGMVFMVSLSNVFIAYFLALRKYSLIFISLVGLSVLALNIGLFHSTINAIVNGFVVASATTLAFLIALYMYYFLYDRGQRALQERAVRSSV